MLQTNKNPLHTASTNQPRCKHLSVFEMLFLSLPAVENRYSDFHIRFLLDLTACMNYWSVSNCAIQIFLLWKILPYQWNHTVCFIPWLVAFAYFWAWSVLVHLIEISHTFLVVKVNRCLFCISGFGCFYLWCKQYFLAFLSVGAYVR